MIKISHLVASLSVITMAYQVRNLDHFLKFRLTGFRLSELNCMHCFLYTSSHPSEPYACDDKEKQMIQLHRVESESSMVENMQYLNSDTIQALRTNNNLEDFSPPSDGPRVLPTSTDHLSPSPQSTSHDQVHIHNADKMHKEMNTQAEELVYQEPNSHAQENEKVDHEYDLIKTNAVIGGPARRTTSKNSQRTSASPKHRSLSPQLSAINPCAESLEHHRAAQRQRSSPSLQSNCYEPEPTRLHPPVHRNTSLGAINEATPSHNHQLQSTNEQGAQPWYLEENDAESATTNSIAPYMTVTISSH